MLRSQITLIKINWFGSFYLQKLFFYIFEFLSEEFKVCLEALHLHHPPLLQCLITLSHQLEALGHFL